jgi:putative peptidoglycan lipid II flippase
MAGELPAGRPASALEQLPGPLSLWALAFAYACFMALMLQKLILPIMPELHAGHGLMSNDAIIFHDVAVALAQRIHSYGWSEWQIYPGGSFTGNVGLLAALYVLLGPDPAWFIPVNAGVHALGALLIYQLGTELLPGRIGRVSGLFAGLLFLTFPSSLVWYGQNHKDAFVIAGTLAALIAFLKVLRLTSPWALVGCALMMGSGLAVVAAMRPHMLAVYAAAFGAAWLLLLGHALFTRSAVALRAVARLAVMVAISTVAAIVGPLGHTAALMEELSRVVDKERLDGIEGLYVRLDWQPSKVLPKAVDRAFYAVSLVRAHFIASGRKIGAGSIVDGDVKPESSTELVSYLPRALVVGLFAPFPDTWAERPTMPRVIGAIETLLWYLLAPGILALLIMRPSRQIVACLIFGAAVLTVLSYTSPNVGTLHRIRYGQLFLFVTVGAIGWAYVLSRLLAAMPSRHAVTPQPTDPLAAAAANLPGRAAAVGASSAVFLITAVGYLGLLARDLLLINVHGFGSQLDGLFSALMLPMFLVSVVSLPLGDALITAMQRLHGGPQHRLPLVRAALSVSLFLCGILCLATFGFGDVIIASLLKDGDTDSAAGLLRLGLPLLLFSGLAVAGNSVLNSLNRPTAAAAAQLLVPIMAIGTILAADKGQALQAAVIGMILGQLANIAVVFAIARREGYLLRPGTLPADASFAAFVRNYGWLVVAALVINVGNPVNFWFAGTLEAGSVSTWAMGSKLVQLVSGLTAAIMAAVVTPYLAKLVAGELRHRLSGEFYVMLVIGSWLGILAALIIFLFSEPFVVAAFSGGAADASQIARLAFILKLGALQIPFVFSTMLLIKLAAVSQDSSKIVVVSLIGLLMNIALNVALIADFGVVGMAAAWAGSVAVSTLVLLLLTLRQTGLSIGQVSVVIGSWAVLGGLAMALHLRSIAVAVSALILLLFVAFSQWRAYRQPGT